MVSAISLAVWLAGSVPAQAADRPLPSATPQRPSLSFGTGTVPRGHWELEGGGLVADGGSALQLFLKYGLTGRTELELGLDAVRRVETATGPRSSVGDVFLGLRSRFWERDGRSAAVVGWLKAPTAIDGVGSGEFDAGAVGVFSTPLGRAGLDANLWLSGLGREDDSILGQLQAVVTLGFPVRGCWSSFAELAWQRTAIEGDGGFFDAGLACSVNRKAVFDVAAGTGWSEGYPDWSLTLGWTILLDTP